MAVNIPATAIRQPSDALKDESTGINGYVAAWKGPWDDLHACAIAIAKGDIYEGKTVASRELQRIPGNWGLLTINLTDTSSAASSGLVPLVEKWSIKSCRNDVSIMAYCGDTNDNPNRAWIECWQREPDAKLANADSYKRPNGSTSKLIDEPHHTATSALLQKIRKGIESVIRFYPMVIRRRIYSTMPPSCLEKPGYIDTPTIGSDASHPGTLASKISQYQWLKVQDDADQLSDNEWQRVEAWMGIKKAHADDSPWDPDLYGDNRWPMPYVVDGQA